MLLQYPKLSSTSNVARYEDFRKLHHNFINVYKDLYDDIAVFALLPEKFIQEASPVIEEFLEISNSIQTPTENRLQLQVFRDFTKRFYQFIDEATEMFTLHQSLSAQTSTYMQKVSELSLKHHGKLPAEFEHEYIKLLPELSRLNESILKVRAHVDCTSRDLKSIRPIWDKIKSKIAA